MAEQEGRYSVVVSNATTLVTNYAYLHVDTQFTKITDGAIVNDRGDSYSCSWADYDNDGLIDLIVANGGNEGPELAFLYRNNGDGTFARMTTNDVGTVASDRTQSGVGLWGDYDNDGYLDLFLGSSTGLSRLYHNIGDGRFTAVTNNVGVNRMRTWGGSWADIDNDGSLDLFFDTADGNDWFFLNNRDGTFAMTTPLPELFLLVFLG